MLPQIATHTYKASAKENIYTGGLYLTPLHEGLHLVELQDAMFAKKLTAFNFGVCILLYDQSVFLPKMT